MSKLFRRLSYLLHRRRHDRELSNDMDFHREMSARAGHPFGNALRLREESRDAWGWTWIDSTLQDLHYAARKLRQSPGFTLTAVLTLAIGIGVNVAAFGFFNMVFFQPLDVRDPGSLVRLQRRSPQNYSSSVLYPEMAFVGQHSRTLTAVMGVAEARLNYEGIAKPLNAAFVTPNLFTELGAAAKRGRLILPSDGAQPVVVLGELFWRRTFAADPEIAGKTIRLDGKHATVIGVVANEFSGLSRQTNDVWLPVSTHSFFVEGSLLLSDFSGSTGGVNMWARLQPGVTAPAAEAEMRSLIARLRSSHPADIWENEFLRVLASGSVGGMAGGSRGTGTGPSNKLYPIAGLIGTLVFLILVVTCANVGGLLLARGVAREREIAIRISIGAGRARLVRQLFTESLLLASLASIAGLGLGYVVLRELMISTGAPAWLNPTPDWRVLAFSIAIAFTAAILAGLTPALQIAKQRHRATALRQYLLAAQVAGSCVLIIVSGLLVRALNKVMTTDPGFAYQQVVSINPNLSSHGYTSAAAAKWLEDLRARLRRRPGVQSVSFATNPPLGSRTSTTSAEIKGRTARIHLNNVDPEFFTAMGLPLVRGRNLSKPDTRGVVVSQSLATKLWPGEEPLGQQLPMGDRTFTIVGIAASTRGTALKDPDAVEAYFLAQEDDMPSMTVLVKAVGPPEGLLPYLAREAHAGDPRLYPQVETLKASLARKLSGTEQGTAAVALLGLVALVLASMGIVGLVSFAVSQRTKEIGIRMGARPAHVLSILLRQLTRPVAGGLLLGIVGAAALGRLLRSELYGVSELDPVTYLSAIALFAAAATAAAMLPARRALQLNPVQALRHD